MKYEVLITARARQEAQSHHDWWAQHRSAEQALHWYEKFVNAALSLEQTPDRFVLAAENDRFPHQIRQLNFGCGSKPTHRIVYTIRSNIVAVLRVRHLAQQGIDVE